MIIMIVKWINFNIFSLIRYYLLLFTLFNTIILWLLQIILPLSIIFIKLSLLKIELSCLSNNLFIVMLILNNIHIILMISWICWVMFILTLTDCFMIIVFYCFIVRWILIGQKAWHFDSLLNFVSRIINILNRSLFFDFLKYFWIIMISKCWQFLALKFFLFYFINFITSFSIVIFFINFITSFSIVIFFEI
jgi:hypothetical protein